MHSFKTVDIFLHQTADSLPAVQSQEIRIDNSTPWRFQYWDVSRVPSAPSNPYHYLLKNRGSGKCLAADGLSVAYQTFNVRQFSCNSGDAKQLWGILDRTTLTWETVTYPQVF